MIERIPIPTIKVRSAKGKEFVLNEYEFFDLVARLREEQVPGWTHEYEPDSYTYLPVYLYATGVPSCKNFDIVMRLLFKLITLKRQYDDNQQN